MKDFIQWFETKVPLDSSKDKLYERATTVGIPVRRGSKPFKKGKPYASDVGDFGRGVYYSSNYHLAKQYGNVSKLTIKFANPLILNGDESYQLADKYKTVNLSDEETLEIIKEFGVKSREEVEKRKLENAQKLTDYMLKNGHDGLIAVLDGRLEIVDYRPYKHQTPPT